MENRLMGERLFSDESIKPDEINLKNAFGNVYNKYKAVMDISDSFSKDWNFSKSSGWMLKVHNKKKSLFYLIPLKQEFKISMAIRGPEREKLLKDSEIEKIHKKLLSSEEYREGFVIRFTTRDENYESYEKLIRKLVKLRI
jgi:hypothetical protein